LTLHRVDGDPGSVQKRTVAICVVTGTTIAACLAIEPMLSSTQQAAIVVSPTTVNFGNVPINTTSAPQTITIVPASNTVSTTDTITSITAPCSDFTVSGPIPATIILDCGSGSGPGTASDVGSGTGAPMCTGNSVTYMATFHPIAAGSAQCSVTFNGTSPQTIQLNGNGTLPAFAMSVKPSSLPFGDKPPGVASAEQLVHISNDGAMTLTISATIMPDGVSAGVFAFGPTGMSASHQLATMKAEDLGVTCTPPVNDFTQKSATLTIMGSNVPKVDVALTCRGTDSKLDISPSPLDLSTRVFEPNQKTVTIKNTGTLAADITKYTISGADLTTIGGTTGLLAPGASTMIDVRYAPTAPKQAGPLGMLVIDHDAGKQDTVIVTGEALATSLSVNPDGMDFQTICAGVTSMVDVGVFANAPGQFNVTGVTAPGTPFTFGLKTGNFPQTAQGGHRNEIAFQATAHPTAPGTFHATATLKTNIPPGNQSRDVVLNVNALPMGVGATPSVVNFGTRDTLQATTGQVVQLTNCSGGPLDVSAASIGGRDITEFAIASPFAPKTLAPAESMDFLVVMSPHTIGTKTATLDVTHAQGVSSAALDGAVTGTGEGSGDDRGSYYHCSASGDATGALPIGFALGFLVSGTAIRRRRRRARRAAA
jgi:hypothetical protein